MHQAANGVVDSHNALVDLLESIEHFLKRLDIYTKVSPTPAMDEIVVKILVELLSTLALATKELKQGRPSESVPPDVVTYSVKTEKFVKKLFGGDKDVEAILQRLDRLTQDEARATAAEILNIVHGLVQDMSKRSLFVSRRSLSILPSRRKGIGRYCTGSSWYVCWLQQNRFRV